jgi:plastocyanin
MRTTGLGLAAVVAAGAALIVPTVAPAATRDVVMGTPPKYGKTLEKALSDANAFFPSAVTVNVGDKVRFIPAGFHNVDLPAKGGKPRALVSPQGPVAGATDPAGQPYWFNGQPNLGFTPSLANGNFGKSLTYDGSKAVQSGLPLANRPKPMTVSFKKAGSFTYYCDVHPGMKGSVKVVGRGRPTPSAAATAARAAKQAAAAVAVAKRLAKSPTAPPKGVVYVGVAGKGGVEHFAFSPARMTVPRGTALQFRMAPGTYEDHTATAGPGDPEKQPKSFLGALAGSFQGGPAFDPAAVYPSERPGTTASLAPTLHGNGFWNSGFMDGSAATPPPNASAPVRFDTPGSYAFYCLVHPFMKATVTVQ